MRGSGRVLKSESSSAVGDVGVMGGEVLRGKLKSGSCGVDGERPWRRGEGRVGLDDLVVVVEVIDERERKWPKVRRPVGFGEEFWGSGDSDVKAVQGETRMKLGSR